MTEFLIHFIIGSLLALIGFSAGFLAASIGLDRFYRMKYEAKLENLINEMVKIWHQLDQQNKAKAKQGLN